jgi:hypothetical protein
MKRLILLGLFLSASQAFGQSVDERSGSQMLCTPFVSYARNLLTFLETASERSVPAGTGEALRGPANATVACAESAIRLWSHPKAEAELAATQARFETGAATSIQVGTARVNIAKATYCEAAFSNAISVVEQYARRKAVGLVGDADVAPVLKSIEALIPICGWSG